jgi:outer membrane protein assembly factor BamB
MLLTGCKHQQPREDLTLQIGITEPMLETGEKPAPTGPSKILAQWRGPNRNGKYPGTDLLERWPAEGPELLWKYDKLGVGYASAAVTDKMVYTVATIDDTSAIHAFDHRGILIWENKLGPEFTDNYPGSRCTPTICKDFGYFLSGLGVLYCFESESGDIRWAKDIKKKFAGRYNSSGYSENLIVHGDMILCTPSGEHISIVALNRYTGDLVWKSMGKGEENAYANPLLIERCELKIFVIQMSEAVIGVDISNGQRLWEFPMESELHSNTPLYKDGYLFLIDGWNGRSVKLELSEDGRSVRQVWRTRYLAAEQGDVILLNDRLYGADVANKSFNCVDWNSGRLLHKITRNSKPNRIATVWADSMLYCYSGDGYLYLVKPLEEKFETRGKIRIPGGKIHHYSHPVIHNKRLYIRYDNTLFVYNIAAA